MFVAMEEQSTDNNKPPPTIPALQSATLQFTHANNRHGNFPSFNIFREIDKILRKKKRESQNSLFLGCFLKLLAHILKQDVCKSDLADLLKPFCHFTYSMSLHRDFNCEERQYCLWWGVEKLAVRMVFEKKKKNWRWKNW